MSALYLNVPVKDTKAARNFYAKAGFKIKEEFSNPISETVVINDSVLLMLVDEAAFKESAKRAVAPPTTAEVVLALELDDKVAVDKLVDDAVSADAEEVGEAFEHEGMYTRIFRDPYGHQFNVFAFL